MFYNPLALKCLTILSLIISIPLALFLIIFIWIPFMNIIKNLILFPGAIFYRVIHKFFCDIANIPVYKINYFIPLSTISNSAVLGVAPQKQDESFVTRGCFLISSVFCMLLSFQYAVVDTLGINFIAEYFKGFQLLAFWIAGSIGFYAIPNKNDINQLNGVVNQGIDKMTWSQKALYILKREFVFIVRGIYLAFLVYWFPYLIIGALNFLNIG